MNEEKRQPKTKEELEALKKEISDLYKKLSELTEDERKELGICFRDPNELTEEELAKVNGGMWAPSSGNILVFQESQLEPSGCYFE